MKSIFPAFLKSTKIAQPIIDGWNGNYNTWEGALSQSGGYNSDVILEKCKASLLKVKNGEAIYERDSVLFDKIQYSWALLAYLERVALEKSVELCVLDFGGSLGSSYFQNKNFLSILKKLQWCIVEQEHFVQCGKEYFENEQLSFFYSIDECVVQKTPNVLLLSSVLQYLKEPYEWITNFTSRQFENIIIDCTPFNPATGDRLTVQHVPQNIYTASYPCWFLDYNKVINSFSKNYQLISEHENNLSIELDGKRITYRGFLFKLK